MSEERYVVRLRGLPWSATDQEISEFLSVNIVGGENGIKSILTPEGRPSGEAYVELFSSEDMQAAMDKDQQHMGKRYVEVFSSTIKEMEFVLDRSGQSGGMEDGATSGGDTIVRMRGLPWQCTKDDITTFFTGLEIVPNGILLPLDGGGRASGEAYVEFSSPDDASQALGKHKEKIGHRYIEIFKSSRREVDEAAFGGNRRGGRPGPYDRPGGRGGRGGRMGGYGGRGGYGGGYGGGYDDYSGGYGDYYEDDYGDDGYGGYNDGYGGGYDQGYDEYGDYYDDGYGDTGYGGDDVGYGNGEDETSGYIVHMRGLPFKATDEELKEFFSPVVCTRVHREYAPDGRITGEANVEFASYQDAQAAMQKNKQNLQHRYIELFYRGQGGQQGGGMGDGRRGRPRPLMQQRFPRGGGRMRGGMGGPIRRGRGRGGYGSGGYGGGRY